MNEPTSLKSLIVSSVALVLLLVMYGSTHVNTLENAPTIQRLRDYRMEKSNIPEPISALLSDDQIRQLKSKLFEASPSSELRLLYRASRDGFTAESFHRACDNKGPTVTIAKYGKALFGGYASVSWRSTENIVREYDDKAMLFSITSVTGQDRWTIHKIQRPKFGIVNRKSEGPKFGRTPDLTINGIAGKESISVFGTDYECDMQPFCNQSYLTGSITFVVDDYEVYSVY